MASENCLLKAVSDNVQTAAKSSFPNAGTSVFIIGHTNQQEPVMFGGRTKLNGILIGKSISLQTGMKSAKYIIVVNAISPILNALTGLSLNFSTHIFPKMSASNVKSFTARWFGLLTL